MQPRPITDLEGQVSQTSFTDKVRMLLNKTVENGCTEHEEATSVALALRIIEREALPHSRFEFPIRYNEFGVRLPEGQLRVKKPEPKRGHINFKGRYYTEQEFMDLLKRMKAEQDAKDRREREARARARASSYQQQSGPRQWKSIGDIIEAMIVMERNGEPRWTYADILHNVRKHFPNAKTTASSVRWYESKLRKEGRIVPKRRK